MKSSLIQSRMIKACITAIILISAFSDMHAQLQFQSVYGTTGFRDDSWDVKQMPDSSYVLSGQTAGNSNWDAFITRIDKNGNIMWTTAYTGSVHDFATAIIKTNDGGLAVTGRTNSIGAGMMDIILMKLDPSGNLQWGYAYGGTDDEQGLDIIQTSDGGYAITGYTLSFGLSSQENFILKTDNAGNVQWFKAYGGSGIEKAYSIIQTTDGGYAICGTTNSVGQASFALKTDASGAINWMRAYSTGGVHENLTEMVQTIDGGYLMVGEKNAVNNGFNNDIRVIKTDASGSITWAKTYDTGGNDFSNDEYAEDVVIAPDGNYVITGFTNTSGSGKDAYLMKINTSGNVLWMNAFDNNLDDVGQALINTSDGGFAMVSQSGDFTNQSSYDFFFVKTDGLGKNGCEQAVSISVINEGTASNFGTESTHTPVKTGGISLSNITFNSNISNCCPNILINFSTVDVSCNGGNDGQATANASGGATPYTYAWSNGETSQTTTGLSAGTYTITVTDINGCTSVDTVQISEPLSMTLNSNTTDATCGQNDGSASVSASGGASPYTYSWSSGGTASTETGLPSGSYTVTVTDNNGCTSQTNVNINNIGGPSLSTSVLQNVLCYGNCDGQANTQVTGGNSPYQYNWSSGGSNATETGLCAGTYTVTVTDSSGCISIDSVQITEPPLLTANILNWNDVSCNGNSDGSATVSANGGTTSYSYSWSSGGTSATETGLSAGTYTVTVTDNNGCTDTSSVLIDEPLSLSISINGNDANCGQQDGSAYSTVTGGTSPYIYQWSSGGSTANETGLSAGIYILTVTDNNGCTQTASVTVNDIGGDTATASVIQHASCYGDCDGAATVSVSGNDPPYTYSWSSGGSSSTETGLCAGVYTITVTNNSGCSSVNNVTITEPSPVVAIVSNDTTVCKGDSVILSASGGVSYSWSTGETGSSIYVQPVSDTVFTVTVTDGPCYDVGQILISISPLPEAVVTGDHILCDEQGGNLYASGGTSYLWSTGSDSSSIWVNPVADTWYYVTVSNSCGQDADSILVEMYNDATADAGNDTTINKGNSATLHGTGGISYYWTPSDYLDCATCQNPHANPPETTTYYLIVTNENGCKATDSMTVFVDYNCVHQIPNVFSPNGDGKNDYIHILGGSFALGRFIIYNRWGEKVFETTDPSEQWDGTINKKLLNPGVYVYYLNGTCQNGIEFQQQGNITLVK